MKGRVLIFYPLPLGRDQKVFQYIFKEKNSRSRIDGQLKFYESLVFHLWSNDLQRRWFGIATARTFHCFIHYVLVTNRKDFERFILIFFEYNQKLSFMSNRWSCKVSFETFDTSFVFFGNIFPPPYHWALYIYFASDSWHAQEVISCTIVFELVFFHK